MANGGAEFRPGVGWGFDGPLRQGKVGDEMFVRVWIIEELSDAFVVATGQENQIVGFKGKFWVGIGPRMLPCIAGDHGVVVGNGVVVCAKEGLRPTGQHTGVARRHGTALGRYCDVIASRYKLGIWDGSFCSMLAAWHSAKKVSRTSWIVTIIGH